MRSLLLLALLLIAGAATAQDGGTLNCRLLNFQRGGGIKSLFVLDAEGKPTECRLPSDSLSDPVRLPAEGRRILFRKEPDGEPVAVAEVPRDVSLALLLFLPSPDPKFAFKPVVLDGSDRAFPKGGSLVLNTYTKDVRFIMGEHKIQLQPGKSVHLERPEQRNNFNMAGVTFQFETDKGWRAAYESMIRFPEGQRHLFVAFVDPKSKRPRIRAYRD